LGLQWRGDFAGSFFSNKPQPFSVETGFVIHSFLIRYILNFLVIYVGCSAFCPTV
jgi:hypothetical protein